MGGGIIVILREEDIKELEKVPAGKWHGVIDFARYLTESHRKAIDSPAKKRERP